MFQCADARGDDSRTPGGDFAELLVGLKALENEGECAVVRRPIPQFYVNQLKFLRCIYLPSA
jgi:hypothetical protein